MGIGIRIAERLAAKKMSQAELARQVGLDQSTINSLVRGHSRSSAHLHKIARVLDVSVEYLEQETDDPSPNLLTERQVPYRVNKPEPRPDVVEIDEINIAFGMGGAFQDEPLQVDKLPISRRLLARYTKSEPEHIFSAIGIGDSMYPTIHDRDLVFVDRSQTTPRMKDQIWALAQGEIGMIKRVRPMPDGSLVLLSDNPNVPNDVAYDGEVHVIGRVVAVLKNL